MTKKRKPQRRAPNPIRDQLAAQARARRQGILQSARLPAMLAVERMRNVRHATVGVDPHEGRIGFAVIGWVAGGWARPDPAGSVSRKAN